MSEHREPAQPGAVQGAGAWRRLARMGSPRLTKANVLVLALAVLLGFAISTQVHQTRASGLESLRQEELVGVLDTVTQEGVRLGTELRTLERTRDRLASGADSEKEAVDLARARADTLALLAGTEPATGPGVRLTITDPSGKIGATILLDAIQELRDAGAEVMQVGPVRVVASTYFTDSDGGVSVSGTSIAAPYTILAIGDPDTMASAMGIPGGVSNSVSGAGGELTITPLDRLDITAVHEPAPQRFATPEPVPTASASS